MTSSPVLRRSGFSARLVPLVVALGALPLMAPTCGDPGEGAKVFSRRSLIIPMDVCYQCTLETTTTGTVLTTPLNTATQNCASTTYRTPAPSAANQSKYQQRACPQRVDRGDVMKAYGLVYQLIRNKIAVYWIIEKEKDHLDDYDLTVQYNQGSPVFLYDWAAGGPGASPLAVQTGSINYMGGAFVVDGADYDRAVAVLQSLRATFSEVNVHVSNVAFRGYAMKTMAGGWDAGGAVPPKLALLDIASGNLNSTSTGVSNPKNAEIVIQGYLERAGIGTGTAGGSATGTHGEIYDKLGISDFQPTSGTDPTTSRLFQNGYSILWIPHWVAPGSCADISSATACFNSSPACTTGCSANRYTAAQVDQTLKAIGRFAAEGNDVFAECAGIGSLEGAFKRWRATTSDDDYTVDYKKGASDQSTRFQTTLGVRYNELPDVNASQSGTQLPPPRWPTTPPFDATYGTSNLSSPLLQIGDFAFIPFTGAIEDFRPQDGTVYKPGTTRLIGAWPDPAGVNLTRPPAGTVPAESIGKWDYFTYLPSKAGVHGSIVYLGGHSYSGRDGQFQVAGSRLVLNTLFNLGAACTASGISCATGMHGACAAGTYQCQSGQPICIPNVQPGQLPETCNGVDDNCNGAVDEDLTAECYEAPAGYVDPLGRTGAAFLATRTQGVCSPGVSSCVRHPDGTFGMSECVGERLPTAESCDGLDNDCNAEVDDELARTCYGGPSNTLGVGECRAGTQVCQSGAWGENLGAGFVPGACKGEVLPTSEACADMEGGGTQLDSDCDGQLTSCGCSTGQTRVCFTGPGTAGVGICRTGVQTCESGDWGPCTNQVVASASPEVCTTPAKPAADPGYVAASDTNCDGRTFQCLACNGSETRSCWGSTFDPASVSTFAGRGQCTWGTQQCQAGSWGPCEGWGRPSTTEYCDSEDNDCDGPRLASPDGRIPDAGAITSPNVDESAVCPADTKCLRGVCVPSVCGTEVPPPEGYSCDESGPIGSVEPGPCGDLPDPDGCAPGEVCQYGTCIDPCPVSMTQVDPDTLRSVSLVCGRGTTCGGGACIGGGCYETGCAAGSLCRNGACVADACAGRSCPSGTFCRDGDCVQACTFVSCFAGQKCGIDGFCEADPCAGKTCGAGQRCTAGVCAVDPCLGKSCAAGQLCVADAGIATCVDDPCTGISCPAGVCSEGQCFPAGNPTGAGTAARTASEPEGGCGCGSGGGVALPALLALLAAPLARRRRRGGVPPVALVVALAALSLASACKDPTTEDQFDPRGCVETCGEQRCVDTLTDPAHCGPRGAAQACDTVCVQGFRCAEGLCVPAGLVGPYVASVSPASGTKDSSVVVSLAGERFQAGATVRVGTPLGMRTVTCPAADGGACRWLSGTSLRLTLDLSGAPVAPGTPPWTLRVVNADGVISNLVSFSVVVPVPTVVGVVPSAVDSGTSSTLLEVSGTGFTSGSQCWLEPPAGAETALPSALSGAQLDCALDASGLAAGSYQLSVMSETGVRSNSVAFTVRAADPVIVAMDPTSSTSTHAVLTVTGARFDDGAKIVFDATVLTSTRRLDDAHLVVDRFLLPAIDGTYPVKVRNGNGRESNEVAFTVGTNPPSITSFTPSIAYQGNPAVALVFTGTSFPTGSVIELTDPAGASSILPSSTTGCSAGKCTGVTATKSLIRSAGVPEAEGTWQARIRLGGATGSGTPSWPMRVLSNQAILRNYASTPSPSQSGQAGTTKQFVFEVSNVHGVGSDFSAVTVWLEGPIGTTARTTRQLDPSPDPTAASTLLRVGYAPAAAVTLPQEAGLYELTVRNPNALPSNALTFAVTPGPPTLAASNPICRIVPAGTGCPTQAQQSPNPVTVKLRGTNFAAADQNGNGSTIMIATDFSPGFPDPEPCGTTPAGTQFTEVAGTIKVWSSSELDLTFDSQAAYVDPQYGTTVYVSVWNPSGGGTPLKSGCGANVKDLPKFRIVPNAVP